MPELPEVETVCRGLRRKAVERRIQSVAVLNRSIVQGSLEEFKRNLRGCLIRSARRHGKLLIIELSRHGAASGCLLVHLGMTGQLTVSPRKSPLLPHTHVRIFFSGGGDELRYRDIRRFGVLCFCSGAELEQNVSRLGPDALAITLKQLRRALSGRRSSIKAALLNQALVAGIGNIYADESLFSSRIYPATPAGALTTREILRLHRAIMRVLQKAVALQGTSFRDYIDIEGKPGGFEPHLKVYGRAGQPCPRCGEAIKRLIIAGRSSHFCSACQPALNRRLSQGCPTAVALAVH